MRRRRACGMGWAPPLSFSLDTRPDLRSGAGTMGPEEEEAIGIARKLKKQCFAGAEGGGGE